MESRPDNNSEFVIVLEDHASSCFEKALLQMEKLEDVFDIVEVLN